MGNEPKKYRIKVPVYISDKIERAREDIFCEFKLENLIEEAENIFKTFNQNEHPLNIPQRSNSRKTTSIAIEQISYERIKFNEDLCLLLKVTAFKTNFVDGFYQSQNKDSQEIRLKQNDKIGSNTYCFILYPIFRPAKNEQLINIYWHIFIYEDPSKTTDEMHKIASTIMRKLIKAPIHNIKADKMLEDLRKCKILPKVEIILSSLDNSNDGEDQPLALKNYTYNCTFKKEKSFEFESVKVEDAINAFEDLSFKVKYPKRFLKLTTAYKRTFSIIQEFTNSMKETLEDSFNYSFEVEEDDIKKGKIFKTEIIKKNVEGIFTAYLYNNSDQ